MKKNTATTSIIGQRPGEEPFLIKVQIGIPCQCGNDPEEWACPVSLTPLYKHLHDAHGGNSLQALCLAVSLALDLLQDFKEKGGALRFPSGEEFPLESYSFGVARKGTSNAA
jgi:hypothetical protein